MRDCLIVGGGLSGLVAARTLADAGWQVTILDKSRGLGGRMATRRIEGASFDHGAQFFTVRHPDFAEQLQQWESAGHAATWFASDQHPRYRGLPAMNFLARTLLPATAQVHLDQTVNTIAFTNRRWRVRTTAGHSYDAGSLVLTPPAPQTRRLLDGIATELPAWLIEQLDAVHFHPCFSLLVQLDGNEASLPDHGYLRVSQDDHDRHGSPIQTIADNFRKGISARPGAITIHSTAVFAADHLDVPEPQLTPHLIASAAPYFPAGAVVSAQLHRWRYSQPAENLDINFLYSSQPGPLLITGDAYAGSRIEGAFLSGLRGARHLLSAAA